MPELGPLPPRPAVPVFRPRADEFRGVVARAHRRRRTQSGAAGAGLAGATAVVVAIALHQPNASNGLDGVNPAVPGHVVTTPHPSATNRVPRTGVDGYPPAGVGSRPAAPGPGGDGAGVAAPPAAGGAAGPAAAAPSRPVVTYKEYQWTTTSCGGVGATTVEESCVQLVPPPGGQRMGTPATYAVVLCRRLARGGTTLSFADEQAVEFEVYKTWDDGSRGRTLWRWSQGYPFAAIPSTVTVGDGRCGRWSVQWNGLADDGRPITQWSYTVSATIRATTPFTANGVVAVKR